MMSPDYEVLVDVMKKDRNDIVIARIESNINQDIALNFGIYAFPTLVLFEPHNKDFYVIYNENARDLSHMISFLNNYCEVLEEDVNNINNNNDKENNEGIEEEVNTNFLNVNSEKTVISKNNNSKEEENAENMNNKNDKNQRLVSSDVIIEEIDDEEEIFSVIRKKYLLMNIKYQSLKEEVEKLNMILKANQTSLYYASLDLVNDEIINSDLIKQYKEYYNIDKIEVSYSKFIFYIVVLIGFIIGAIIFIKMYKKMFIK